MSIVVDINKAGLLLNEKLAVYLDPPRPNNPETMKGLREIVIGVCEELDLPSGDVWDELEKLIV